MYECVNPPTGLWLYIAGRYHVTSHIKTRHTQANGNHLFNPTFFCKNMASCLLPLTDSSYVCTCAFLYLMLHCSNGSWPIVDTGRMYIYDG